MGPAYAGLFGFRQDVSPRRAVGLLSCGLDLP